MSSSQAGAKFMEFHDFSLIFSFLLITGVFSFLLITGEGDDFSFLLITGGMIFCISPHYSQGKGNVMKVGGWRLRRAVPYAPKGKAT